MRPSLDPDQSAAARGGLSAVQPYVVAACPGSGKTTTLVEAVTGPGVNPARTTVITYTRAAAQVLRSRLASRGAPAPSFVGTLHSWSARYLGYKFTPVDEEVLEQMAKTAALDVGCKASPKEVLALAPGNSETAVAGRLLLRRMQADNLVSYDGLLLEAAKKLKDSGPACENVFWDEAQDGAEADHGVVRIMASRWTFAVGDPDQCIYKFRGARPDLFEAMCQDPRFTLHRLKLNYRCPASVVGAANALISRNRRLALAPMRSQSETQPGHVEANIYRSEWDEWDGARRFLESQVWAGSASWGQCAVLCRTNAQVQAASEALKAAGIPITVERGAEPKDWKAAKLFAAAMAQPFSDLLVHSWLRHAVGEAEARRLATAAKLRRSPICEVAPAQSMPWPPWRDAFNLAALDGALSRSGLSVQSQAIVRSLAEELAGDGILFRGALSDAVNQYRPAVTEGAGAVVTTAHQAKGREWHVVVAATMDRRPGRDGDPEEERRLAYVAATRASRALAVSASESRRQEWGRREEEKMDCSLVGEFGLEVNVGTRKAMNG